MTTQTRPRPGLAIVVKRHPLVAFFVLAYALTWWVYPLLRFSPLIGLLGLFGPALAAIVVTAVTDGRRGVTALLKRAVRWRVPLPWYVVAVGLPAALALLAAGLYVLLGPGTSIQLGRLSVLDFVLILLVVGEELGWRGYALPKLVETGHRCRQPDHRSPVVALAPAPLLHRGNTSVQSAHRRLPGDDYGVLDPAQLGRPARPRQRAHRDLVPRGHQHLPGLLPGRRRSSQPLLVARAQLRHRRSDPDRHPGSPTLPAPIIRTRRHRGQRTRHHRFGSGPVNSSHRVLER